MSKDARMTLRAHVKGQTLHLLGMVSTSFGVFPFSLDFPLSRRQANRPVDMHGETDPEIVTTIFRGLGTVMQTAQNGKVEAAARNLVERSRAGDQNALSLICAVRQNRTKSPRVQASYDAIQDYIKRHPAPEQTYFQGENVESSAPRILAEAIKTSPDEGDRAAAVSAFLPHEPSIVPAVSAHVLANGPDIDGRFVIIIEGHLPKPLRRLFRRAMRTRKPDDCDLITRQIKSSHARDVFRLGWALGRAAIEQAMKRGEVPISHYSEDVAWELGE
jgi:hypothetical protein